MRREAVVTERLSLWPLSPGQAHAIAEGDYSGLTLGAGWPTSATPLVMSRAAAEPGALTWLIVHDGRVIGECGLKYPLDADGSAEIGYGVGAAWWGAGYGTEAVRGLVGWLETVPGCRRLTAEVHETNVASRRLLERLGFTIEELAPPYVWYAQAVRRPDPGRRAQPA